MSARLPDLQRDATKYGYLINALKRALREIHEMESNGILNIDTLLTKLLPVIAKALDAEKAFVAKEHHDKGSTPHRFLLLATHPTQTLVGNELHLPDELSQLLIKSQYYVHDPVGVEERVPVPGLELFAATSAVLKGLRIVDQQYVVGVCDKRNEKLGPFLVADRVALDSILELVAAGARSFERHRREHEAIQLISQTATKGNMEAVWQIIARHITELTQVRYTTLVQVEKTQNRLRPVGTWDGTAGKWNPQKWTLPINEQSLNGFVAGTGNPHYIPEIRHNETHYQRILGFIEDKIKSAFSTPLRVGEETIGTIYLASTERNGISQEDRDFVVQLAPHAAIALQNTQLLEDAKQRIKIDETIIRLQRVTADLLSKKDQSRQIREVLNELGIDISGFYMATFNETNSKIEFIDIFVAGQEIQKLEEPRQLNDKRGFTDYVIRKRRPLFIDEVEEWNDKDEIDIEFRRNVHCCLVIPLQHQEEIVGVMGLLGHQKTHMYAQSDFDLLSRIAPHLAIVIKNSQVYEQRVQELRAVSTFQREISDVAESEQDEIGTIYEKAHAAIHGVGMSTDNLLIAIHRPDTDIVEFPIVYERGKPIPEVDKVLGQVHEMYAPRILGDRGDMPEYVIRTRESKLGRTKVEIMGWQETLDGVKAAPTRSLSWLGVPMIAGGELIGMIALRHFTIEGVFENRHVDLLKTVAAQTAIALQNARRYQTICRQAESMQAVYHAGKTITQAGLERNKVLQAILIEAATVTKASFGTLQVVRDEVLEFVAAWPPAIWKTIEDQWDSMPINGPGITARAARLNKAQYVSDVTNDVDYIDGSGGATRSEIAVALRRGGDEMGSVVGVLNVEHSEVNGFSEDAKDVLITLSNLAVVAIQNAEQAEKLQTTNTIALMGAWGADVVHDLNREVGAIRRAVYLLRKQNLSVGAMSRIEAIENSAKRLALPELPDNSLALDQESQRKRSAVLDSVIKDELRALKQDALNISIQHNCQCGHHRVVMHEQWVRRLVRHYVKNSIRHLRTHRVQQANPMIKVSTTREGNMAVVLVDDNGFGVRKPIKDRLFRQPIEHDGERSTERAGRGLLLVRYIAEAHGGKAWLDWTEEGIGARFAFSAPLIE